MLLIFPALVQNHSFLSYFPWQKKSSSINHVSIHMVAELHFTNILCGFYRDSWQSLSRCCLHSVIVSFIEVTCKIRRKNSNCKYKHHLEVNQFSKTVKNRSCTTCEANAVLSGLLPRKWPLGCSWRLLQPAQSWLTCQYEQLHSNDSCSVYLPSTVH